MKEKNTEENIFPSLNIGIGVSLLIHIALFSLFFINRKIEHQTLNFEIEYLPANKIIQFEQKNEKAKIIPEKKEIPILQKNQIVDESDIVNNEKPKDAKFLAEKNNSTKEEKIKRGNPLIKKDDGKEALIIKGEKSKIENSKTNQAKNNNLNSLKANKKNLGKENIENKNVETKKIGTKTGNTPLNNTSKKSEPKEIQEFTLSLDTKSLMKNFGNNNKNNGGQDNFLNDNFSQGRSYKPFSRASGSGARFLGKAGSSMYIPGMPDGDMTILNTKAEYFAVFVRRVAMRVFSALRQSGWEMLSREDIMIIHQLSEFEAVMDLNGNIKSVVLNASSGSSEFDNILKKAISSSAKDSNPPANAKAEDGNIHFIFQARSWSRNGIDPSGAIGERRWLLLQTGLK